MMKKATTMDKSTSKDVLCPADPQSSSGSGQILSGQVVSSKVMEEALHLNLKLTPFESFQGDGSIFKAFFHGKVICTEVLSKVLPAVTFKGGEHDEEGNEKVVLQNDTLLSFSVIAREMVSLRGDAGLDISADCTVDEKSAEPGHHGGESYDCNTSTMKDNRDGEGDINIDNESDHNQKYACSFGCREFTRKKYLVKHMKIHARTSTQDHVCKICSKAFLDASLLEAHQYVHSDNKPFKCTHCDKAYTLHSSLKRHVASDHAKVQPNTQQSRPVFEIYDCSVCGKMFEDKSTRLKHQLTHKKYKYPCSFGCRAFTSKQHLATHMKVHTSTRDHLCNICSKAFSDASSLDIHKYIHSTEKPFKCMHCDKAYNMRISLRNHVAKHHPKFRANTQQNMRTQTDVNHDIPIGSEKQNNVVGVEEINKSEDSENVQKDCTSIIATKSQTFTKPIVIDMLEPSSNDVQCPPTISILQHRVCERNHQDKSDHDTHIDDDHSKNNNMTKEYTKQNMLQRHIMRLHADTCTIEEISVKSEKSVDQCMPIDSEKGDKSEELENIKEKIEDISSSTEHCTSTVEHDAHIDNDDTKNDSMIKDTLPCPVLAIYECKECGKAFEDTTMLTKHQLTHEKYKYPCSFGCRAFSTKQHLVKHMTIHTRTHDHVCKICSKAFFDASSLDTHQYVHSDDKPFKCTHCDKAYTMHDTLKKHISRNHAKFQPNTQQRRKRIYACSLGCRTFTTRQKLAIHMTIHTQRTRDHVCNICSKAFFNASSLETHQLVHSTKKPFKCTHCDKAYTMRNSLRKHALVHQAEHQPYKCHICGRLSSLKSTHESHLRIHSNVRAFQCEVCGKQFRSKNNLAGHVRIHTGYKKFQCDQCDKSYRNRQYLEVHKKTHTGENLLQCEMCGDWFSDPGYFKRHQREYCKGKLNNQCEVCGQSFPNNRHLVSHMGLHSGERPFGCDVCGKAFAKPEGLADHVKRHNPETDFRCRYCGKFWISKSELAKHEVLHERQKLHVRLPEEMKPGRFRSETTVGHGEMSKPDQTSGDELGTPGIEEIVYSVTDTSDGSGQGLQQMVSIGDGGDGDQGPQPIVTYDENIANHPLVIYVGDGVGAEQSMSIYIDHAV